ncbi:MAG: S46 family peptidase [Bacteroidales bacterium]
MKKIVFWVVLSFGLTLRLWADEGMWLPLLLEQLNEKQMHALGLKLTARDLYDINHTSLKDGIVQFGGGCTAELVSPEGLLLTNHHCGYGEIQRHSSLEHDYLANGFWAMSRQEELPCPGLTVSFLIRMEDVTAEVMTALQPEMNTKQRNAAIDAVSRKIADKATEGTWYKAQVKPFFSGNQFYLLVYETFEDVRLVGAPPSAIGKFGGDTDNWMWPRHTGDFSVFRIYADSANRPAPYNPNNRPFRSRHFFPISLKGVEQGDFTFVYGFPGTTQEYLPAVAVETITEVINPIRIKLRGIRLDIMNRYMEADPATRIQYASKNAGIANGWKKWQGENNGIHRLKGLDRKRAYEARFEKWAQGTPYQDLLPAYQKVYEDFTRLKRAETWLIEAGFGVEALSLAQSFSRLVEASQSKSADPEAMEKELNRLRQNLPGFFKDYNARLDCDIFVALMRQYVAASSETEVPEVVMKFMTQSGDKVGEIFDKSLFTNKERLTRFLDDYKPSHVKKIVKDPLWQLASGLREYLTARIRPALTPLNEKIDSLQRLYMQAQMLMQPERVFYPDANSTLRITYGNVEGYQPRDAVYYMHYTTLDGVMEKDNPEVLDYQVPERLKELWNNKDFGPYSDKEGKLRTAFIATNHTSGGNSGSPVLNADGQLVGINFDRVWEGTMSDLMYDPQMCRNISLDIRYCLFIIDKYAGASHLIREMTIIQ